MIRRPPRSTLFPYTTLFRSQVRLDEAVSRALYAGDDRSALTGMLLEVLTTPGAAWFRVVVSLPVLFWLGMHKAWRTADRKSTRLNSSHANISYAVFCLKKKN